MSEGLTHVQERNEQLAAGDAGAALKEPDPREILRACSRYTVVRFPYGTPLVRRATQRRRGAGAAQSSVSAVPYVSAANPYPISPWRPAWFWTFALGFAAAILVASAFRRKNP
jgi:hypothetical protein